MGVGVLRSVGVGASATGHDGGCSSGSSSSKNILIIVIIIINNGPAAGARARGLAIIYIHE